MLVFRTLCTLCLLLLLSVTTFAGSYNDARSIAMAGSYTAIARGYETIGLNPANLALSDRPNTSIGIFGVGSLINNNAFSKGDYDKYNGSHLSEQDKQDILDKIPADGLEFKGNTGASALSLSYGPFGFSTTLEAGGRGTLSKDVVDLAFFGNKVGETINVDNSDGEGIAHVDFNLSYGRKIKSYDWGNVTAGLTVKYIRGLAVFEITQADAQATTGYDGVNADGSMTVRSSTGGSGYGIDIGAAANYGKDWVFSLGIKNLASSISWNNETKQTDYYFDVVGFTVQTADEDTTVVSDEIEHSIGSYSTTLAPEVSLGASTNYGKFLVASDLKLGLKDSFGTTTTPELSVGTEYSALSYLPLRAGLSLGGIHGSSLALGGGVRIASFSFDVAWASSGTVLPKFGNGMSFAVSSGLKF